MEHISQLGTASMIFMTGMATALILPNWITFFFIAGYIGYQFNIISLLYQQIPADLRYKYKSKVLIVLEWMCSILRQAETNIEDNDYKLNTAKYHSGYNENIVTNPVEKIRTPPKIIRNR